MSKSNYSEDSENFYLNEQNKKIKKNLNKKYGMDFNKSNSKASPEIMNEFLKYVEQFEAAWETVKKKMVYEILECPSFKPLHEIKPNELEAEIEHVLNVYADHNINVEAVEKDKVINEEFYLFLTQELLYHETEDIKIPGMRTNFIYEDFRNEN